MIEVRFTKSATPSGDAEARAAAGRQHVAGPGEVVADRLGRVRAEEQRARGGDPRGQLARVAHRQLGVLGREAIHGVGHLGVAVDDDDGAVVAQRLLGDRAARKQRDLALHLGGDSAGDVGAARDQDWHRQRVVLGLRQQIGGDPARIDAVVGDDDQLGRAGDRVDADVAEDQPLGGGDVGVAGAHDLVDARDALRAVGERGDRLRAADHEHARDAGEARGQQRLGRRPRRGHHDLAHAGDLRRHGGHHHRRGIARGAAGDVDPDARQRIDAAAGANGAFVDLERGVTLALVERAHAAGGALQRGADRRRSTGGLRVPLAAGSSSAPSSRLSNFSVSARTAASPPARTSAMILRAAASTSSEVETGRWQSASRREA